MVSLKLYSISSTNVYLVFVHIYSQFLLASGPNGHQESLTKFVHFSVSSFLHIFLLRYTTHLQLLVRMVLSIFGIRIVNRGSRLLHLYHQLLTNTYCSDIFWPITYLMQTHIISGHVEMQPTYSLQHLQ